MSLSLILIIVALVLAALDMILWNTVTTYRRVLLTPLAVVLTDIALLIGTGAIH